MRRNIVRRRRVGHGLGIHQSGIGDGRRGALRFQAPQPCGEALQFGMKVRLFDLGCLGLKCYEVRRRCQVTAGHCAQVGAMLARMHLAGRDYPRHQPNLRGLPWWNDTVPVVLPFLTPEQSALIRAELAYQNHVAALPACQALPRGPIHADLFRDNVMFDGDRLCGFFDFYFAGCDTFLFDIAVCLNDWCVSHDADPALDGRHDAARAAALLSAYQAVRPLTAAERQLLPALLRAGALRFWLSRLWDLHLPREAALLQPHDPGHFERVLRGRLQGGLTEAAALLDPAFETA